MGIFYDLLKGELGEGGRNIDDAQMEVKSECENLLAK